MQKMKPMITAMMVISWMKMIQFPWAMGRVAPLGGPAVKFGDASDEGLVSRSNDDAHARSFHGEMSHKRPNSFVSNGSSCV